jgi:hypothetical protein
MHVCISFVLSRFSARMSASPSSLSAPSSSSSLSSDLRFLFCSVLASLCSDRMWRSCSTSVKRANTGTALARFDHSLSSVIRFATEPAFSYSSPMSYGYSSSLCSSVVLQGYAVRIDISGANLDLFNKAELAKELLKCGGAHAPTHYVFVR